MRPAWIQLLAPPSCRWILYVATCEPVRCCSMTTPPTLHEAQTSIDGHDLLLTPHFSLPAPVFVPSPSCLQPSPVSPHPQLHRPSPPHRLACVFASAKTGTLSQTAEPTTRRQPAAAAAEKKKTRKLKKAVEPRPPRRTTEPPNAQRNATSDEPTAPHRGRRRQALLPIPRHRLQRLQRSPRRRRDPTTTTTTTPSYPPTDRCHHRQSFRRGDNAVSRKTSLPQPTIRLGRPRHTTIEHRRLRIPDRLRTATMAEFVRAQIFGTTFEITSRYGRSPAVPAGPRHPAAPDAQRPSDAASLLRRPPTRPPWFPSLTSSQILGSPARWHGRLWTRLVGHPRPRQPGSTPSPPLLTASRRSSARDQLTNQNVAVKKIMKPFSTPVLAKRTYRELKLLKHLRHENVRSTIRGPSVALIARLWRR